MTDVRDREGQHTTTTQLGTTDSEPAAAGDVFALIADQLADPEAAWNIGTFGAIGEFVRDVDEKAELVVSGGTATVLTDRGAIRLSAVPGLLPFAFERPTGTRWSQTISLCLPEESAAMSGRTGITELGVDEDAVRPEDRDSALFDLGLGASHIDMCVRTRDETTIACLRAAAGKDPFDPEAGLLGELMRSQPHRIVMSRCGRIEVFSPIPPPDGASPEGPHTHILPKLLARHRTHPHADPLPEGTVPVAGLVPPQALVDINGEPIPFDRARYDRFQGLLARYGDPAETAAKNDWIRQGLAGRRLPAESDPGVGSNRRARTLAERQLGHLTGTSSTREAAAGDSGGCV